MEPIPTEYLANNAFLYICSEQLSVVQSKQSGKRERKSAKFVAAWALFMAGWLPTPAQVSSQGPAVVVGWGVSQYSTPPAGLTNVIDIQAGASMHNLALKSDGNVVPWGYSWVGPGNLNSVPSSLRSNVIAIAVGAEHNLALRSNLTVVAWGHSTVPSGLNNVIAISAGAYHNLALRSDSSVVAWGADGFQFSNYGQITAPPNLSNVVAVAGGGYHSLALKTDSTVVAWGAGGPGQSADRHYGQSTVPEGLSNVIAIAIAAGGRHSLILKSDGTVVAWGMNFDGQCTVPAGLRNVIAIAGGYGHSLALIRQPPKLDIAMDGNVAMVSWPLFASDHVLESSPILTVPNWEIVTNAPAIQADRYVLTNSRNDTSRFFRLRAP